MGILWRPVYIILPIIISTLFDLLTPFPLLGRDTGCGGRLNASSGIITTPNYPNNYGINTACLWIITLPNTRSRVNLKFEDMDIENHSRCRYDYILVRDGNSENAPIIAKLCGKPNRPEEMRSSTNRLWIRFYSDSAFTDKGFKAVYTSAASNANQLIPTTPVNAHHSNVGCGGVLSGSNGIITSPSFPSKYPNGMLCIWRIPSTHASSSIQLKFEEFDLEDSYDCRFDYVKVQSGLEENSPELSKSCGPLVPSTITGSSLRITFVSDRNDRRKGFLAKWARLQVLGGPSVPINRQSAACGGNRTGVVGFLRSTNYPDNYENNQHCIWNVIAQPSMKIQLRFSNMEIEPSSDCSYDYVEVKNGISANSSVIGRYCGSQVPNLIETSSNEMNLVFHTDDSDTRSGFEATWVALFKDSDPHRSRNAVRKPRVPGQNADACGGILKGDSGTFQTTNYPNKYPAEETCTWVIEGKPGYIVRLTFSSFKIEKHSECRYDRVVIRDGSSPSGQLFGSYCGRRMPPAITSFGQSLSIQFKSDSSSEGTGFRASWQLINKRNQQECGGRISRPSGELKSPNYPSGTTERKICTWTITVERFGKVRLEFKDLSIRTHPSCALGYIQVFDGDSIQGPELGTFCGYYLPRPVVSSRRSLTISFLADGSVTSKGFKAAWTTIIPITESPKVQPTNPDTRCGSHLRKETGQIIMNSGTKNCTWIIRPISGERITLSIVMADLVSDPKCGKEMLEVRNGLTALAPRLLRICGNLQPQSITSFSGALRVSYLLHGQVTNAKLRLKWTTSKDTSKVNELKDRACGITKVSSHNHFTGGQAVAVAGALPWMVGLLSGVGRIYCGGGILARNWVITAAHCLERFPFFALRKIVVGKLDLSKIESSEQIVPIQSFYIHPSYNSTSHENDIALLKLDKQITFNDKVNAICLPDKQTNFPEGKICSTAGWGTRRFLGRLSVPLVHVRPPLVSKETCNATRAYDGQVKYSMICAGRQAGGLDSCQGDGGGPLTCETQSNGNVLIGISSWGNGCAYPNKYGVYTNVRDYLDWIENVIGS